MIVKYETMCPIPRIPSGSELMGHCYLCGRSRITIESDPMRDMNFRVLEREHVVPKVVFKPHSTDRPVLLWACRECNARKGANDEFVTNHIQLGGFNDGTLARAERVRRSIERPQAAGLRADFEQRWEVSEIHSPGGIYLGTAPSIRIDSERLSTYMIDIAKGLWVRNSLRLKNWAEFNIKVDVQQSAIQDYVRNEPVCQRLLENRTSYECWEDHFLYSGTHLPLKIIDSERLSFWMLEFYSSISAYVTFAHKDGPLASELLVA